MLKHRFGAAAVLLAALAIRAPLVLPSLPYLGYVDEGHVLHPVLTLLKTGGWDPQWYLHPSLTIYLITLLVQGIRPVYLLVHGHSLLKDLQTSSEFYDLVSPPEVILAGRFVILVASLGIVALGMVLASRIAGPRAALGAGVLLALGPALVQRGAIVIVDTVATLCVLATLLSADRLHSAIAEGGADAATARREALVAGLLAGASAAAKYPAGLVVLVVFFALLGRHEWRSRGRLLLIAAAGAFLGAIAGMPAFVLRPRSVLAALLEQSRLYSTPALFSAAGGGPGLFKQALSSEELGLAVCVLGVAGLGAMLWRPATRTMALAWLVFATALVLPVLVHSYQPFRYALPLVPPCLIAAAVLLFPASPTATVPRVIVGGFGLLFVLVTFVPGWRWTYRERGVRDSRVIFIDWLAKTVHPNLKVLFVRELAFLPKELDRVPATVVVAPWKETRSLIESGGFDALVCGKFDLGGARPTAEVPKADMVRFESWLQTLTLDIQFGWSPTPVYPGFWRSNNELILVAVRSPSGPLRREPVR